MAASTAKGKANDVAAKSEDHAQAGGPVNALVTLADEAKEAHERALRKRDTQAGHLAEAEDAVARTKAAAEKARKAADKAAD